VLLAFSAAPVSASAAPWDGPRTIETMDGDFDLHAIPRAFTVTWEPGVEDHTTDAARRFVGPEVLDVQGLRLERIRRVGAPRMHTEEYRLTGETKVPPSAVARALAALADVRVAAPLFRLSDAVEAPWRAVTSDVLLQLVDPAYESRMNGLADELGADAVALRPGPPGQWRLRMRADAPTDPVEASMRFREQAWVLWSQADWIQPREERYTPTDDRFETQWHLNNIGQGGGIPDHDVNAPAAWDLSRGDPSVIVAILDSGVELDHEDLEESLLPGYDFVDNDDDPSPNGSHGTSVSGAAAAPENGFGVVGVCPLCSILPIRVIGASDSGEADAHIFAVDNGAWVINNSWGPPDGNGNPQPMGPAMEAAIDYVMESGRGGKGTPVFWASGNGHPNDTCSDDGYASHDDVIAIGSSTNQGTRPSYSEICPELDLSSPSNGGSAGITTTRTGDGYTNSFGGTSAAAPVATGVGAIVLWALPDLTASQLQALLEATAQKIDQIGGQWDENGHSIHYGWGRIDAAAALQSELAFLDVPITLATCEAVLEASVSIPNGAGLGTLEVTAQSETEPSPETFTLTEAAGRVYTGSVPLTSGPAAGGDGFISVSDGDTVTIASADSETTRTVSLDCRAPELSSVTANEIMEASARILWVTDEIADGLAKWGDDSTYDETMELAHSVHAINLEACTTYRIDLESTDALGNVGVLNNAVSFTTAGDPALIPSNAPDDADPCDPTTWREETPDRTPGPIRQDLTAGDDDCDSCSIMAADRSAGAMLWVGVLVLRRRRRS
jgi:hypothetical protein